MDSIIRSNGGGGPGGGGGDSGHMVAYPPIRPTQGGRGGFDDPAEKARHTIKMRGLPYSAKEEDITKFFQPHVPAKVVVEFDQFQRPSGSAEVLFNTHEEAEKAMDKHNGHMGHRYIELFLLSRPGSDGGMGGRDGGGGGEYGGRGGATGAARYPPQTTWGDTRSAQPQGMYGGSAVASQQQPQQYVQPSYGGYQQQQQQPAQPQAPQQWPQQGGYQSSGGYQQGALQGAQQGGQQPSYQPQSGYQTQTQPVSGYQQPPPTGQDGYSQLQPQTQWY
ncbi:Heterogeneous nuclear ribonucleoprotein F [Geodia barretti]|uniref:Heterogeneous nuclear ribonucleoprotein F n=1 Tax=Geodia barretti TaxID=519541 RepID=A0AA35VX01_GEOBA|nr:Heterogeneous nuclear ribonucleoprotein F [Geodia barretti]